MVLVFASIVDTFSFFLLVTLFLFLWAWWAIFSLLAACSLSPVRKFGLYSILCKLGIMIIDYNYNSRMYLFRGVWMLPHDSGWHFALLPNYWQISLERNHNSESREILLVALPLNCTIALILCDGLSNGKIFQTVLGRIFTMFTCFNTIHPKFGRNFYRRNMGRNISPKFEFQIFWGSIFDSILVTL